MRAEYDLAIGKNRLVSNTALGKSLAETLGGKVVVLLRAHGNAVVASDIRRVVPRAIYGAASVPHLGHVESGSDGQDGGKNTVSRRRGRFLPGILPIPASLSEFRHTP